MALGPDTLSDREKEVLRLLVQNFDAKSIATQLGVSVHAVNERLRSIRRKFQVTSSREAARVFAASERSAPNFLGDKEIVVAPTAHSQASQRTSRTLLAGGIVMLLIVLGLGATLLAPAAPRGALPNWQLLTAMPAVPKVRNEVRLEGNRLLWNGAEASENQISEYLKVVRQMNPQPPTILSHGEGVPQERLQRVRMLIDNNLQCSRSTCTEVTRQRR